MSKKKRSHPLNAIKKTPSKKKFRRKKSSKNWWILLLAAAVVPLCFYFFSGNTEVTEDFEEGEAPKVCQRTKANYGSQIDSCSKILNVNPKYLKALVCLECSGKTGELKRFERHVFKRLQKVRDGQSASYEGITTAMIHDASDEALKNLATSWGPFQIMGYKCLHLNIRVSDLRGKDAVYWGIKWIKDEYGHLLKSGRYRDAFHYHNTGRIFPANGKPTTYDKKYVPNGLEYMRWF
ncbi:MAG: N-acetylmuramidase family protein [Bacteroidales bacterium]|nr:N-acetylmuramidase family protein [Bacteroidales bacterium]